jgi:hypothetical protein
MKILSIISGITVVAWILGALILGLSNKSQVNISDPSSQSYCKPLCFDLIYLKSIIMSIVVLVLIIILSILIIMGCVKKNDYIQKPEKKTNENK